MNVFVLGYASSYSASSDGERYHSAAATVTSCKANAISGADREMEIFFDTGEKVIFVHLGERIALGGMGRGIDSYCGVGRETFGDRVRVIENTRMSLIVADDGACFSYIYLPPLCAVVYGSDDDRRVPHDVGVSGVCVLCPCL